MVLTGAGSPAVRQPQHSQNEPDAICLSDCSQRPGVVPNGLVAATIRTSPGVVNDSLGGQEQSSQTRAFWRPSTPERRTICAGAVFSAPGQAYLPQVAVIRRRPAVGRGTEPPPPPRSGHFGPREQLRSVSPVPTAGR